jgi:hypothetical protein
MAEPNKFPSYYVTQTLLGGGDVNRRTIYRSSDHEPICVFNQRMHDWTAEDDRLLNICLAALMSDAVERGK